MKRGFNWKVFLACFLIVFGIAFIGSIFTSGNTSSEWYLMSKPSITPPGYVFPVVWNILYFLIVLSLYFSWTKAKDVNKKAIALSFGINLVANGLWSYLFFELKNPLVAFLDLIIILTTATWMIFVTKKVDKKSSWMLLPYLIWLIFAGYLNLMFVI